MLIRFLSIATMSVTLLTIQAFNSTETKSSIPKNTIQSEAESIFSNNSTFSALYRKKEETDLDKQSQILNAKFKWQHQDKPKIMLASIGPIALNLPKVKLKERPSYLPPIDFVENEEKNEETSNNKDLKVPSGQITASLTTKTKIEKRKPRQISKAKSRKKKVAKYKKYKYKKYNLGKSAKRKKSKRKYRKARYKPVNYMSSFQ